MSCQRIPLGIALTGIMAAAVGCGAGPRGILVMAHGGDAAWNRDVETVVAPLRERSPVEIAYGMAVPSALEGALKRLEAQGVRDVAVVRMFISGDSFIEETEYILGLRAERPDSPLHDAHAHHTAASSENRRAEPDDVVALTSHDDHAHHDHHGGSMGHHMEPLRRIQTNGRLFLSRRGVAESPLIDDIIVDRVRALSKKPEEESVLLLAHGPGSDAENERWLAKMRLRAQRLYEIGPFRHVQCETLREDWPERRSAAEQRIRRYVEEAGQDGRRVIVVPFRIAGFGPYSDVLAGLDYVADGRGFCPHPNLTRWIEETAESCFAGGASTR
jgi:sirohydrochlorin cobaltochelatase